MLALWLSLFEITDLFTEVKVILQGLMYTDVLAAAETTPAAICVQRDLTPFVRTELLHCTLGVCLMRLLSAVSKSGMMRRSLRISVLSFPPL